MGTRLQSHGTCSTTRVLTLATLSTAKLRPRSVNMPKLPWSKRFIPMQRSTMAALGVQGSTPVVTCTMQLHPEPEAAAAPPCSTLHRWNPRGIRTGTSVQICMATEVVRATRVFMRLLSTTTALHERQLLSLEWKRRRTKCLTMQVAVPLNIHSEKNHLKSQAERCFWLLRDVGGEKKKI